VKCKTFDLLLKELNKNHKKMELAFRDKRLSLTEKKIILGHLWIRDNHNVKVVDELSDLPESEEAFVRAHSSLLLGIAHLNLSNFHLSSNFLNKAEKIFNALELNYYHFIAVFNLFMLSSNSSDIKQMQSHLLKLRSIPTEGSDILNNRLKRCEFIFADEAGEFEKAARILEELNAFKDQMPENDIISHLVSEFMFYVKFEKLEKAKQTLIEMKKYRKFHLNENFNFMKKMLDNLTLNTPIYISQDQLIKVPLLHYQLQVIKALEASDDVKAIESWNQLKMISPSLHGDPFEYKGTVCLFSLGLDKYRSNFKKSEQIEMTEGSKIKKLMSLLKSAKGSVPKPLIYELLWGEYPESKEDLKRLTRLVSKVRSIYGIEIKTRKGCYFLEEESKEKIA
jgi:tetratricopeptide (TPR) repeat protein